MTKKFYVYSTDWIRFASTEIDGDPSTHKGIRNQKRAKSSKARIDMSGILENPKASASSILVAIATFNEKENIRRTIRFISSELPFASVLIVDDSDDNESLRTLEELRSNSNLTIIHRNARGGQNTAYNFAASYCLKFRFSWLLFVEADVLIKRGALAHLLEVGTESNFDVVSFVNYPIPHGMRTSFKYANYLKCVFWTKTIRESSLIYSGGRVILIKTPCIPKIFPEPDDFSEASVWITASAMAKGLLVKVLWDQNVFFMQPQTLYEAAKEEQRFKYCSEQVSKSFPQIFSRLSMSMSPLAFLKVVIKDVFRKRKPDLVLMLMYLSFARLLGMSSKYRGGNLWHPVVTTKEIREYGNSIMLDP